MSAPFSDFEIALLNECAALAEQCGAFVVKLKALPATPPHADPQPGTVDQRWVAMGADDLQTSFMKLMRSIEQPATF